MVKKIFISYSKSEKVSFCFWKCFFHVCGIWTNAREITKSGKECSLEAPHLIILGNGDADKILPREEQNRVYLVKKSAAFRKYQCRKDVFRLDRWDNNDIFLQVVKVLFGGFRECTQIQNLLVVFKEENLWEAFWLFNEFAYEEKGRWDDKISDISDRVLKVLESKKYADNWHSDFMQLYCRYIYCGASDRSFQKRIVGCENVLKRCGEMSRIYGWVPSLLFVAAQACGLVETEEKYALFYYRDLLKHEKEAEIYYRIGYVYEKKYLEKEKAYKSYRKAYEMDSDYYRALYKIAVFSENQGKWMSALQFYNQIRNMLKENDMQHNIYISEIEYYYKACKKIIRICSQNIDDDKIIEFYKDEIEEIQENIRKKSFSQLVHCMFGKQQEKQIREEITEEIEEKIKRRYDQQ